MGQYYVIVILGEKGVRGGDHIRAWLSPHALGYGVKLMEHAYIDTKLMNAIEAELSEDGTFYKSRVVWAGDYADPEPDGRTLHELTDEQHGKEMALPTTPSAKTYRYITNHTKREYIDKETLKNRIHPLPLLTAEGNGAGGGDYRGHNEALCGSWARDVISMDNELYDGYTALECDFYE